MQINNVKAYFQKCILVTVVVTVWMLYVVCHQLDVLTFAVLNRTLSRNQAAPNWPNVTQRVVAGFLLSIMPFDLCLMWYYSNNSNNISVFIQRPCSQLWNIYSNVKEDRPNTYILSSVAMTYVCTEVSITLVFPVRFLIVLYITENVSDLIALRSVC